MRFLSLALTLLLASVIRADCLPEDQIANQFIIRLKQNPDLRLASKLKSSFLVATKQRGLGVKSIFEASHNNWPTVFGVKTRTANDLTYLLSHPEVDLVEPDCRVQMFSASALVPIQFNDPHFHKQWALQKISAPLGWNYSKGSNQVTVAVSDSGIDYLHEDLNVNMWTNSGETPSNNIDDDRNGCIDDIYGCDFGDNSGDPMPLGDFTMVHGTHVAGLIGAVGNNGKGVSGVAPVVKLMAVKIFDREGHLGSQSASLKSIYYAVNNGARLINCSWGRRGLPTSLEKDAIQYAEDRGVIVVAAAGNSNLDAAGFSPAGIPAVVTVASTDSQDQLSQFSNWGDSIDFAAPGGNGDVDNPIDLILSTFPRAHNNYGELFGTSMAAPFVTGLAALVLSVNLEFTKEQVLKFMREGADSIQVSNFDGTREFTYKRINVVKTLELALKETSEAPIPTCASTNCQASSNNELQASKGASSLSQTQASCAMIRSPDPKNKAERILLFLLPLLVVYCLKRLTWLRNSATRTK